MRSFYKHLLWAVMALVMVSCGESREEAARRDFEEIISRNKAVGLAVVAVKDGQVVYDQTFGYRDMERQEPWEGDDVLRIASISKSFTATGILQLVEQGKLSLDADVSDIMGFTIRNPHFPDKPITVQMLLSHTSSMSDANGYFSFDYLHREKSSTWEKAWNKYEPGTGYQYCNLGFNTLGAIIEKVSGVRFDKYISTNILEPLGVYANHNVHALDSSRFVKIYTYSRRDSSFRWTRSAYDLAPEALEDYTLGYSTTLFSPTGGLKISASDLAKVMLMHMNYGTLDGVKILEKSSSELMQSALTDTDHKDENYGMAIIQTNDLLKGHRLTGHDGLALGAYTAMYWDPEERYGFVVMTNGCTGVSDNHVFANILCESVECLYKNFIEEK
ncbi:MAG: beta-lactamase family protein [Bacteroidales bacterium]|nr:beta-lactamase family protein [Bacteroidales bacterium]